MESIIKELWQRKSHREKSHGDFLAGVILTCTQGIPRLREEPHEVAVF